MNTLWDAIVVGAGPAGCAAATQLSKAGMRVLLLDRYDFPRAKACAGAIPLKDYLRLHLPAKLINHETASWLEYSRQQESAAINQKLHQEAFALTIRKDFDYELWKRACQLASFEVVRSVSDITSRGNHLDIRTACGRTYQTRTLIGADGANSRIRDFISPLPTTPSPYFAIEGMVQSIDLETSQLHFFMDGQIHGYGWAFPKKDHWNIGLYTTHIPTTDISKKALGKFAAKCLGTAETIEMIIGAPVGAMALPAIYKGNILLAGDAMGIADPLYGGGIVQAIDTGTAAALSVIQYLQTGAPLGLIHQMRIRSYLQSQASRHINASLYYHQLNKHCW